MSGKRDLGVPNKNPVSLKEQLVRTTLHNVRSLGHPYVDLREDGKRLIFFCTLCLARCYSDTILFDHLRGNLHRERLAYAQATLMKLNPWPFSDGVLFFHYESKEQPKSLPASGSDQPKSLGDGESLAIVSYNKKFGPNASTRVDNLDSEGDVTSSGLVIPSVLQKDDVSDLSVSHMGVGLIGARFSHKDDRPNEIRRIWCEWGGDKGFTADIGMVPEHEFAIVTFPYNYSLGRKGLFDCFRYLLPSGSHSEAEGTGSSRCKKRKSFSDAEDTSAASARQGISSGEESPSSNNPDLKILLSGNDDQLVISRILSSKSKRKQLRDQQRVASERTCDICQQKMLPDKDVGALLNRRIGKLVCSSRNSTGAFHIFHVSCLIQWILLCEVEIHAKQSTEPEVKPKSKRKVKAKSKGIGKKHEKRTTSVFCPECQGTGVRIEGDELEKPTVPLSEVFNYKIKLCEAHKAWVKSHEELQNCSLGFTFPLDSDANQENVASLKLLHFYRASV